jgi:hypothetical protein
VKGPSCVPSRAVWAKIRSVLPFRHIPKASYLWWEWDREPWHGKTLDWGEAKCNVEICFSSIHPISDILTLSVLIQSFSFLKPFFSYIAAVHIK